MQSFVWTIPPHRLPDITREYRRYYLVTTMVDNLRAFLTEKKKPDYPIEKALENWLIELANSSGTEPDQVFRSRGSFSNLQKVLIAKLGKSIAIPVMEMVTQTVATFFDDSTIIELPAITYDGQKLTFQSAQVDFPSEIYQRLLLAHQQISPKRGRDRTADILQLVLRYQSILPYGDQWAVPRLCYEILSDFGFTHEAFASPINSNFLQLNVNQGTPFSFGSLFYDIDRYFGSRGSFFDLKATPGMRIVANPVSTPELLSRTEEKIKELLANPSVPVTIQFNAPGKLESYPIVSKLPSLRGHFVIPKGKFLYYFKDVPRVAQFDSLFAFFSTDPTFTDKDVTTIQSLFASTEGTIPDDVGTSIVI
jgi:hypothetical protein